MKERVAKRPRPYCQILRPTIFKTNSNSKPTHNGNLPSNSFVTELFDMSSSVEYSNNSKPNSLKESLNNSQLTSTKSKGIESYSCIRSNNWNIIRNSNELNGHRSRRRTRPGESTIMLKNRKFASSKIVRPLIRIPKPELDITWNPSFTFQNNSMKGRGSGGVVKGTELLAKRIQSSLRENKNSSNIRIVDSYIAL